MKLTIEDQIWMNQNKITVNEINPSRYFAKIDFGQMTIKGKEIRYDTATAKTKIKAIQKLCDQNNILSPWEIAKLKEVLKKIETKQLK